MILPAGRALQGSRAEHAQYHRDLPGMVNRVFHDSVNHSFVRIVTPKNLFRQILDGKIPNLLFEEFATLAPAGDEFVPGNRWLCPPYRRILGPSSGCPTVYGSKSGQR